MTTYIKRRPSPVTTVPEEQLRRPPGRPLELFVLRPCEHCTEDMPRRRIGKSQRWEYPSEYDTRKFCNSQCFGESKRGRYKEDVLEAQGHYRARLIKPEGPCEHCGSDENVDVHHEDENPLNNELENLFNLCRRCHYRHHNPVKVCSVSWCERPRRRNGLCEAHDQRRKRGMDLDKPFQTRHGGRLDRMDDQGSERIRRHSQ